MSTSTSRFLSLLREHPVLEGLDDTAIREVFASGELVHYDAGQRLSAEGDPARHYWMLLLGSAKVFYCSRDGREVTVKLFGAPAAWAEMELLTDNRHIEDCAAVDRCTVLRIPKGTFSLLLDAHPRFMRNVLHDTCARFFISAQNEKALAFLSVEEKLASLLLSYLRMYGVPVDGGVEIRIPLSHESLARGIGAVKKTVTRALSRWAKERIVSKRGRNFIVRNPERLSALATHTWIGIDWVAGSAPAESRDVRRRR